MPLAAEPPGAGARCADLGRAAGRWPAVRSRERRGIAGTVRRPQSRCPRAAPPCGGVPGALRFSHKSGPSPWERAILHRALLTENEKQTGPEINHGAQRLYKGRLCVNRAGRGGQLPAARTRTGPHRPAELGAARGGVQVGAGRWYPRQPAGASPPCPAAPRAAVGAGDSPGLACLFVYGH